MESVLGSLVLKVFNMTVAKDEHKVEVLSVEFSMSSAHGSSTGTNLKSKTSISKEFSNSCLMITFHE